MNTLILLTVIGLLGICVWLFRLVDQQHADRAARDRRLRVEIEHAAVRELQRVEAMANHPTSIGARVREDHRNHVSRFSGYPLDQDPLDDGGPR